MAQSKAPPFTLYEHRISPFCIAIRIALNECKQTYTPREVDLSKSKTTAFLKRSPFGRLPALVEHRPGGELAIFESPAILLYLSERFPQSSLGFSDLTSKAQAFSWLTFTASGFAESLWNALEAKKDTQSHGVLSQLEEQLNVLDRHLARRAFLAGDYSITDTLATPLLDLLHLVPNLDLDGYPHVISWRDRLRNRPSYKGAWPTSKP